MAEIIENSLNEAAEAVAAELPSPGLLTELFASPLNLALLGLCAFLLYKILQGRLRPDDRLPLPVNPSYPLSSDGTGLSRKSSLTTGLVPTGVYWWRLMAKCLI